MKDKINNFLDEVCSHIRYKKAHKDIRDELAEHILEKVKDYQKDGLDEEEAIKKSILNMGDSEDIGISLDKQHKPQTEWSIVFFTAFIALIGGIIMFTCSKYQSMNSINFGKYLTIAAIGIVTMISIYFFDYTKLRRLSFPIYIGTMLLFVYTILFTDTFVNGRPMMAFGPIAVSLNFLAPVFLISFAGFIDKYRGGGMIVIIKLLACSFITMGIFVVYPSLGTAVLLLTSFFFMMTVAIVRRNFKGKKFEQLAVVYSAVLIPFLFILVMLKPYRWARFEVFLSRGKSDPLGGGWLMQVIDKWLSASQWLGKADVIVDGYTIESMLPGASTDFVLVNVIATFGWILGIVLILAIGFFIVRMFMTIKKIRNTYGFYLSLAASSILSLQFITSILINFNLFPFTSMGMPFISYGGTNYIMNMALVGIILSVWRRNKLIGREDDYDVEDNKNSYPFITYKNGKIIINLK